MWAQLLNIIVGLFITVAPGLWHFSKMEADNFHIAGPLIVTIASVAWWECNRNVRFFNIPVGLWLLVTPFIFPFHQTALFTSMAAGGFTILLSLIKGKIKKRYGGGWRSLWQKNPLHSRNNS